MPLEFSLELYRSVVSIKQMGLAPIDTDLAMSCADSSCMLIALTDYQRSGRVSGCVKKAFATKSFHKLDINLQLWACSLTRIEVFRPNADR